MGTSEWTILAGIRITPFLSSSPRLYVCPMSSMSSSKQSPRSKSWPFCCNEKSKSTSQLDERRNKDCSHVAKPEESSDNLLWTITGRRKYQSFQGRRNCCNCKHQMSIDRSSFPKNQLESSRSFDGGLGNSSNRPLTVMTMSSTITCEAPRLENNSVKQKNHEPRVLMSDVIKITVECV